MSAINVLKQAGLKELDFHLTSSNSAIINYNNAIDSDVNLEAQLRTELELLGEVKKLLIRLKNGKLDDKKDFILKTINTALNDVFVGQNLKIDIVATNSAQGASKLNLRYDIILYQNDLEINRNEKLMQSNGGGVLSFCSILFKILVGFIYSRNKFFLFDESIAEVSPAYRPRMAQFFRKFCDTHGFTLVLVTQTEDVDEFATLTYRLDGEFEDGVSTLKIDKIEGDYPKKHYIYTKVENFQSIKKLEFRYHGFTVIIGKNNIGKSASFRAVDAILFNNYDAKLYARFANAKDRDKRLNSRIEFGRVNEIDDPINAENKIVLKKKGQSVIYEFDDKEFVGKMLAFDKVKEKVEKIGFKYLNLKESYKNFKGTLKDQTERLAVTTQNDGHYLIGNKSNDTAKVFDFLFDTRDITTAILQLDQDINQKEGYLESARGRAFLNKKYRDYELQKIDFMSKLKGIRTIETIQELTLEVNTDELVLSEMIKKRSILEKLISCSIKITELSNMAYTKQLRENEIKKLTERTYLIDGIIQTKKKLVLIQSISALDNTLNYHSARRDYYDLYHKTLLISTLQVLEQNAYHISKTIQHQTKRRDTLADIVVKSYRYNLVNEVVNLGDYTETLNNRVNIAQNKILHINSICSNISKQNNLNRITAGINENLAYIDKTNKTISYNQHLVKNYGIRIKMGYHEMYMQRINNEIQNINHIKNSIAQKEQDKLNLDEKYNLCTCHSCAGIGVVHKH